VNIATTGSTLSAGDSAPTKVYFLYEINDSLMDSPSLYMLIDPVKGLRHIDPDQTVPLGASMEWPGDEVERRS
jgi:hypothetical protein